MTTLFRSNVIYSGERASGTTTKILSCWLGGYWDKYGCTRKGGGGAEERRAPQELRGNSSNHRSRHATWATTGDETRDSRPLRGAPSPVGTARIERELESQRLARYPGDAWRRDKTRDSRPLRGAPSPVGTARIERELKRSRPARYPGNAWRRGERLKTIAGGAVS